jgi:dihydrofolate reductase
MRKVYGATMVSLDGVMQAPGGPEEDTSGGFAYGGWTVPYVDAVGMAALGAAMGNGYDLLLGRRTYEIFAAYWPFRGDDSSIAQAFNACTKYVATSRGDESLTWQNSVALRGDVPAAIAELKQQDGPDLLVQGSGVLYQTLFRHDLLDELTLLVFPVVLGGGRRLFGNGAAPASFELSHSTTSPTGVVIGTYRRAGAVKTGAF